MTKLIIAQPYLMLKGGAERVILKIAQHYKAKIYTMEYNKLTTFPEYADIEIELIGKDIPFSDMLPYRASQGLRYGYNYYNLKIKDDYDVINSHISPSEWIRHDNKPVLWYCHTPPREVYDLYAARMKNRNYADKFIYASFTSAYKLIAHRIVKDLECIATNSTNTKERIKKYFERDATVINPGIDHNEFTDNGDEKFFLYPSRILANKRQDYVLNAFARFQKKNPKSKHRLIIAGTLSQDKEHQDYFEKLKAMKVKNVLFKTNITDKDLKSLYSRSTAVLFAASNEDFGIVPLEGMASSKPVISVNEGGPRETIIDEKTGFIINSPEEMTDKMCFVVDHPKIAEQMGKAGRKRVESEYTWERFFEKFDPLVKKTAKYQSDASK